MTELIASSTDDLRAITECSLYNDPRVSSKSHTFCVDCSEKNFENTSCPLCRPLHVIPDYGFDGFPRQELKEGLVDLHHLYVERQLKLTGEKIFEIPLIEQFRMRRVNKNNEVHIAWLENRIYITYLGIKRVRVFADQAPFEELPEEIEFKNIIDPGGMTACASSRSLFVSDGFGVCIWKIQFPQRTVSKIETGYTPEQVSITPNNELLVVLEDFYDDGQVSYKLNIHQIADFSRTKSILLPKQVCEISCAVQSPNMNFVISHTKESSETDVYFISILSTSGEIIRTFDPDVFESIRQNPWFPFFFAIKENGDIFVADGTGNRVFLFNPQMTDYQILSNSNCGHRPTSPGQIVYIQEKQQLLVYEDREWGQTYMDAHVSVFHLSPCNLNKERNDVVEPAKKKLQIGRKRRAQSAHDITSKYRKLWYLKK